MNYHIFVLISIVVCVTNAQFPSYLSTGRELWPSWGSLRSTSGKYEAVMQHDGNFVIYKKYNSKDYANPIWSTNTQFSPLKRPFFLKLQYDGNLVMYDVTKKNVVWAAHTVGSGGGHLKMQNDGNLVLYRNSKPVWNSHTQQCMQERC